MDAKTIIIFDNYLRNLRDEILILEPNQDINDFTSFFRKDEVFTIGFLSENKDDIELVIKSKFENNSDKLKKMHLS